VIGTVGNSGNAVNTPPHLHIGIYQGSWRRPVDPWGYFVDPPQSTAPSVAQGGVERIGRWLVPSEAATLVSRIPAAPSEQADPRNRNPYLTGAGDTFEGAEARPDPEQRPPELRRIPLEPGTPLLVTGASGELLRVRSLTGEEGFVDGVGSLGGGDAVTLSEDRVLRDTLTGDAFSLLEAGEQVTQLAETDRGELIRLPSGRVALLDTTE
jgi:hypothetical protein